MAVIEQAHVDELARKLKDAEAREARVTAELVEEKARSDEVLSDQKAEFEAKIAQHGCKYRDLQDDASRVHEEDKKAHAVEVRFKDKIIVAQKGTIRELASKLDKDIAASMEDMGFDPPTEDDLPVEPIEAAPGKTEETS